MDGLELIRTLEEKNCPGEILVLSNYEDFDSVRSALLLGAADYLLKLICSDRPLLVLENGRKIKGTSAQKLQTEKG